MLWKSIVKDTENKNGTREITASSYRSPSNTPRNTNTNTNTKYFFVAVIVKSASLKEGLYFVF